MPGSPVPSRLRQPPPASPCRLSSNQCPSCPAAPVFPVSGKRRGAPVQIRGCSANGPPRTPLERGSSHVVAVSLPATHPRPAAGWPPPATRRGIGRSCGAQSQPRLAVSEAEERAATRNCHQQLARHLLSLRGRCWAGLGGVSARGWEGKRKSEARSWPGTLEILPLFKRSLTILSRSQFTAVDPLFESMGHSIPDSSF